MEESRHPEGPEPLDFDLDLDEIILAKEPASSPPDKGPASASSGPSSGPPRRDELDELDELEETEEVVELEDLGESEGDAPLAGLAASSVPESADESAPDSDHLEEAISADVIPEENTVELEGPGEASPEDAFDDDLSSEEEGADGEDVSGDSAVEDIAPESSPEPERAFREEADDSDYLEETVEVVFDDDEEEGYLDDTSGDDVETVDFAPEPEVAATDSDDLPTSSTPESPEELSIPVAGEVNRESAREAGTEAATVESVEADGDGGAGTGALDRKPAAGPDGLGDLDDLENLEDQGRAESTRLPAVKQAAPSPPKPDAPETPKGEEATLRPEDSTPSGSAPAPPKQGARGGREAEEAPDASGNLDELDELEVLDDLEAEEDVVTDRGQPGDPKGLRDADDFPQPPTLAASVPLAQVPREARGEMDELEGIEYEDEIGADPLPSRAAADDARVDFDGQPGDVDATKSGDAKDAGGPRARKLAPAEMASLAAVALVILIGLFAFRQVVRREPSPEAGRRPAAAVPARIDGGVVKLEKIEAYWRSRREGDRADADSIILPEIALGLASGSTGYLQALFRDETGALRGDSVTRRVSNGAFDPGGGATRMLGTEGFINESFYVGYRAAGESVAWSVTLRESTDNKSWTELATFRIPAVRAVP